MKLNRLNLLSALISSGASCLWLAIDQSLAGLIWLVCSLVWLTLCITRRGSSVIEPNPMRRLTRRLSRLLVWS